LHHHHRAVFKDNDASRNYDNVSGFGPWAFNNSGNAGNFFGSSTANGDGDNNSDGDINTTNAFGLFANNGGVAITTRPFSNPMIPGEQFSVEFDNGFIYNGSTVGIGLQNASGENLMEFYFAGGQSDYKLNASSGETGTGIGFTDEGFALSFSLKIGGIVDIQITNLGSGAITSFTQNLSNPGAGQDIAQLRFFNASAGGGSSNDAFINSLSLCQSLVDADGDGFPEGEDCDDTNAGINPGAEKIYFDDIDNDCDPTTPDENSGLFESYLILNGIFYDLQANTDLKYIIQPSIRITLSKVRKAFHLESKIPAGEYRMLSAADRLVCVMCCAMARSPEIYFQSVFRR